MTARLLPPPHETGDTGYSGDTAGQEPDFRRVFGGAVVPGQARDRGHEPGTPAARAP